MTRQVCYNIALPLTVNRDVYQCSSWKTSVRFGYIMINKSTLFYFYIQFRERTLSSPYCITQKFKSQINFLSKPQLIAEI